MTNLVCRGTIEERILHILETKINMFELVVGELDMILGRIDEDFDFEQDRGGTAGALETRQGEYPYLLLWSPDRLLEEIFPYSTPWHLGRSTGFHRQPTLAPVPRIDLDPVAALLLTRTTARHGLTYTARALAAWWRLPNAEDLLAGFDPAALAAAVDRAIRYWSGAPRTTYPEAAKAFHADEATVRRITPIPQKQLQLSPTRNW